MGYGASYPIPPITTSTIDVRAFSGVAAAAVNSLIRTANRDPIWGVKAGGSVTCAALVADGVLYFGAHDGIFYALDPTTGKEHWRFPTNGPIAGGEFPVAWRDAILFTSFDHHLYCVARDGALVWKFKANGELFTPVIWRDLLFVGSWDCHLYALDWRTGQLRWTFATSSATPSDIDIDQAFAEQTAFTVFHAAPEPAREERYRERAPLESSGAVYNARSEYAGRSQYTSKNPNRYAKLFFSRSFRRESA